jgi:hypothetical protein
MRMTLIAALALGLSAAAALAQASNTSGATNGAADSNPQSTIGKSSVRDTYAECMKIWEPATHMTKPEWSATCRRVQDQLEQIGR